MRFRTFASLLLLAILLNIAPIRLSPPVKFLRVSIQTVFYPFNFTAHAVTGGIYNFFLNMGRLCGVEKENQKLKQELQALQAQMAVLQGVESENIDLRKTLRYWNINYRYGLIPAEVVARNSNTWYADVFISKGSQDGVKEGASVICPEGLIGRVIKVLPLHSQVQLLSDSHSRVSVYLPRLRAYGVLEGGHGMLLELKLIPEDLDIRADDEVSVSSYSETYARNAKIGKVVKASKQPNDMFQAVWVKPYVNFSQLSSVFVVTK